jgi:sugar phosphate isomerase/epimerase
VMHSLHAPVYSDEEGGRSGPSAVINIAEPQKTKRIQHVDEIKRAIEIAETVPFRYLIQHLGVGGEEYHERKIEAAFSSLEELSLFAHQRGVELLVENIPNGLSSAERLRSFFDLTHLDLNVCFDIGHAHLTGDLENEFRLLKPRIRSTHVHDNDGQEDRHWLPMAEGGSVDWGKGMELLRSAPGDVPLLLEWKEQPEQAKPLEAVERVFDQLEGIQATV